MAPLAGECGRKDSGSKIMNARILIVDDHEVVRQGVRSVLQRARPEWEICGEAMDGQEGVAAAKVLKPDVVILDITMPVMSGLEAAPKIAELPDKTRILIFSMHESERIVNEIQQAGAHGYVQKSQAGRDLVNAIESLLAGGTFFGHRSNPKTSEGHGPFLGIFLRHSMEFSWASV